MFITGRTAAEMAASREHYRAILGFLYSTPAYRRTFELFGWDDLGVQLQRMTRKGEWSQLNNLITDEVLDAILPQARWDDLPSVVAEWFGDLVDGVMLQVPADPADDARYAEMLADVRLLPSAR